MNLVASRGVGRENLLQENVPMSHTLPLPVAEPKRSEIIDGMVSGEELVLTANDERVAIVTRPP
jgi:hypothetical protein